MASTYPAFDVDAEIPYLQAIAERRHDDAPRLAFADWLQRRGDPRGRYIDAAIQARPAERLYSDRMRAARRKGDAPHLSPAVAEAEQAMQLVDPARGPLHRPAMIAWHQAWSAAGFAHLDVALYRGARTLRSPSDSPAGAEFHLGIPVGLDFSGCGFGDVEAEQLARCPHLVTISRLDLSGNAIGDAGATAIARSAYVANLRYLDLSTNRIGDEGGLALLEMASYCEVALHRNYIRDRILREVDPSAYRGWYETP